MRQTPPYRYWCDSCKKWALWQMPPKEHREKYPKVMWMAACEFCYNRMWCTIGDPRTYDWPEEAWQCHCEEPHEYGCVQYDYSDAPGPGEGPMMTVTLPRKKGE